MSWSITPIAAAQYTSIDRRYQLAEFFPEPLTHVLLDDPRLSSDPDTGHHEKVVMWSYPIISTC